MVPAAEPAALLDSQARRQVRYCVESGTRPDDLELLGAWRTGELKARDELVRRYYTGVLRFFELRAPQEANDLAQRTFLACFEALDRFRNDASFRSLLFGIARNQLLLHLRNKRRHSSTEFVDEAAPVATTSLSSLVARKQEQHLVLRALTDLDPQQQMLVALYYWEGMRTPDIGNVLECPSSTVTTRLARARDAIRQAVLDFTKPGPVRDSVLSDIDGWTRSLAAATGGG